MANTAMADIYSRLKPLGIDQAFIKSCVLPEWWEDNLAKIPSNRDYAELVIARQLEIPPSILHDKDSEITLYTSGNYKFKSRKGVNLDEYQVARALGGRLAKVASQCLENLHDAKQSSALKIRQEILSTGIPWIDLENILKYIWDSGIPVLYMSKFPKDAKKPDGMAVPGNTNKSIIISSRKAQPAWHLFFVAHELGHIMLGHLERDEINLDSEITLDTNEGDEIEANLFAMQLLSGLKSIDLQFRSTRMRSIDLARTVFPFGYEMRTDPGFLALCYSRSRNSYDIGSGALKILNKYRVTAAQIYSKFYNHLNIENLAEDNQQMLRCVVGVE